MDRSLGIDLSRVIAASVCDHRLGYQHTRRTHTIAAFNFLHHIFADDLQQTPFFASAARTACDTSVADAGDRIISDMNGITLATTSRTSPRTS